MEPPASPPLLNEGPTSIEVRASADPPCVCADTPALMSMNFEMRHGHERRPKKMMEAMESPAMMSRALRR